MKVDREILRKAQLIMLDELLEVDKICKRNNIEYWIADGTLLGAVRHKGFIPWDDDIDICMLDEDYKKFIKIAPGELSQNLFLQTSKTDKSYNWFPYVKVRDRNTIFIEGNQNDNEKYHQGINLDIFVMDLYNDRIKKFRKIYNFCIKLEKLKIHNGKNRYLILKKILLILKINKIPYLFFRKYLKLFSRKTVVGYRFLFPQLYEKKGIFPLKEIEFEGYKFPCPNNVDAYLKELYGDTYMELPPEKDRVWHAKEIRLNEKCFFEKELERTGRKLYEEQ